MSSLYPSCKYKRRSWTSRDSHNLETLGSLEPELKPCVCTAHSPTKLTQPQLAIGILANDIDKPVCCQRDGMALSQSNIHDVLSAIDFRVIWDTREFREAMSWAMMMRCFCGL